MSTFNLTPPDKCQVCGKDKPHVAVRLVWMCDECFKKMLEKEAFDQ